MTFYPDSLSAMAAVIGPTVVGSVLVWTGSIKAIAPRNFIRHVDALGLLKPKFANSAVTASAAFEVTWGVTLIVRLYPGFVFPISIALFLLLTLVAWWGVRSGKATDCGCYGGYIQPSIKQSTALNALLIATIAISWHLWESSGGGSPWKILVVATVLVVTAIVTNYSQRFESTHGRHRFVSSPLNVGARWRSAWSGDVTLRTSGETLVTFLGPECPFCKQWVQLGNAIIQSDKLPAVIGVTGVSQSLSDKFVRDHSIRFPVVTISASLMNRLVDGVPTTVVIDGGIIKETWAGATPPEFAIRFRKAFFPEAR